MKRDMKLS